MPLTAAPPTTPAWGLPSDRAILALYLGLSLMLVLVHAYKVNFEPRNTERRFARHQQVMTGRGQAPFVYRVAVPHTAAALAAGLRGLGMQAVPALELGYSSLRFFFILAALLLFHAFLANWFTLPWTLAGVFLFAALHPASFFFYWFQPASALDLVLWLVAALVSVRDRNGWWLVPMTALGALNRETVLFVAAIHFALRFGREPMKELVWRCVAICLAWACVFIGLRLAVGERPPVATLAQLASENFGSPMWWLFALAFFGALWVLPFRGWRSQPAELRRLAIVLIPYLVLQLAFGRVREVRLLLPLALPLIPLALARLRSASEDFPEAEAEPTWKARP